MHKTVKTALAVGALVCTLVLVGCGSRSGSDKTIVVGASSTPHAEILKAAAKEVEKEGYALEVKEFSDWVLPNSALEAGELDANYFQHEPYMEDFDREHDGHLVSAGRVHFEPLRVFAKGDGSLKSIKDGAKIAVPSDTTNEARALLLLEQEGIITLKPGSGLKATKQDVADNPHHIEIVEVEAANLPRVLEDVDFAVINGNYALGSGMDLKRVQASEDPKGQAARRYANIIAVKEGDAGSPKIKALMKALRSPEVKRFIKDKYQGSVLPSED